MSKLIDNMKTLRVMFGLSQKALAQKLEISQNTVYNWEKGKVSPNADLLEKICGLYDVTPNQLFGWDECDKIDIYLSHKKSIEKEIEALRSEEEEINKRKQDAIKRLQTYASEVNKLRKKG